MLNYLGIINLIYIFVEIVKMKISRQWKQISESISEN
ncbi:hypothetical protein EDC17_1004138 [Sphingobacterium alimentarium]|uniref:Uncharacterized protein n=1 Tax=Sphingobacterium alimentarium TaxID=797292 RepID=A0A4R3VZP6_9SPHI|nr:hypothetical protein EDC17_1004138 [Sphingobacterium alimentarium]